MPNKERRAHIAMTEAEQRAFMENNLTLQVATIGPDGWPHLVAMWYAVIDGKLHFNTYTKSQKILNLRRDPRITCLLESGVQYRDLKGLVIEGEAEIIDDDPAFTRRVMEASLAHRTRVLNLAPANETLREGAETDQMRAAAKRAVVIVHPVNVYSWDHAKQAVGQR